MWIHIKRSLLVFFTFSLLLGVVYPLLITGIAQVLFPAKANGSLITVKDKIVGSELIAQKFSSPKYFHPRPSAIDYDAGSSGGSNLGPTNKKLTEKTSALINQVKKENNLTANEAIPADLVFASASGLDPHISLEAALIQIPRIAKERKLDESKLKDLVKKNIEQSFWGIYGNTMINVLKINISLDNN